MTWSKKVDFGSVALEASVMLITDGVDRGISSAVTTSEIKGFQDHNLQYDNSIVSHPDTLFGVDQ